MPERRRRRYAGADSTTYCVFDILAGPGGPLIHNALELPRRALARALRAPRAEILHVTATPDGQWLYEQALALGLEGIVGKRVGSMYQAASGREIGFS